MTFQIRQSAHVDTWYADAGEGTVDAGGQGGVAAMRHGGSEWRQSGLRIAAAGCLAWIAAVCSGDPARVRVRLDVDGELVASAGREAEPVRQPITVSGRFDFVETPAGDSTNAAVIREYRDATAEIVVDGERAEVILGEDARRLSIARVGTTAVPFLSHGFLTREERDLLDIPFDPLLIDALRPTGVVAIGDTWNVPADIVAGLLAVDTIETGSLEAKLETVSDCVARVQLSGVIDGAVDGVPTHVVIDGSSSIEAAPDISSDSSRLRYRLDGSVSRVTATLRERRQASHVAPGFVVEARVAVSRTDAVTPADSATADESSRPPQVTTVAQQRRQGDGRPDRLWYRDPDGRFDLVHDARWRAVEEAPGTLVLRLVDRGALVAQCSITALPPAAATDPPTIDEVKKDISRSLDGQFERFAEASTDVRSDGAVVVRVVSAGTASALPFRWVHAVLCDEAGQRASVAFVMEASMTERFGMADDDLVAGLRLRAGGGGDGTREARLPRKTATP
jgi:hypothetical protein